MVDVHPASRVYKRHNFLALLCENRNKPKQRNKLIDYANNKEIHAICEIILNVLNGNIKLANANIKKLKRYKTALRSLTYKKNSLANRKKTLKQHGGFLSFILPAAIGLLSQLFRK